MEAKAFMRLNPEYKYLYPVISGSSGYRAAREGVSKLGPLKNEPVRRFLRERETIVPRKKLVDIFGHQVTRLDVDTRLESLRESKRREWLAKGYSPALVDKALDLADEWPTALAESFLPGMPEAQRKMVELNYPKALATAERWIVEMAKS